VAIRGGDHLVVDVEKRGPDAGNFGASPSHVTKDHIEGANLGLVRRKHTLAARISRIFEPSEEPIDVDGFRSPASSVEIDIPHPFLLPSSRIGNSNDAIFWQLELFHCNHLPLVFSRHRPWAREGFEGRSDKLFKMVPFCLSLVLLCRDTVGWSDL